MELTYFLSNSHERKKKKKKFWAKKLKWNILTPKPMKVKKKKKKRNLHFVAQESCFNWRD